MHDVQIVKEAPNYPLIEVQVQLEENFHGS